MERKDYSATCDRDEDNRNNPCWECNCFVFPIGCMKGEEIMDKVTIHSGICDKINALYELKNADYGDAFARARKQVPGYTGGKLYDKVMRYMTLSEKGEQAAMVQESLDDTLMDLANYAIMELTERAVERLNLDDAPKSSAGIVTGEFKRLSELDVSKPVEDRRHMV